MSRGVVVNASAVTIAYDKRKNFNRLQHKTSRSFLPRHFVSRMQCSSVTTVLYYGSDSARLGSDLRDQRKNRRFGS